MDWLKSGRASEANRLISQLSDLGRREPATRDLIRLGAEAVPALLEALQSPDPGLLSAVRQILGRIGSRGTQYFIHALTTSHPLIRVQVAGLLGEIREASSVPALLDALTGEYYTVRAAAASALGQLGDGRAVEPLLAAIKDREPQVRSAAAAALGAFNHPDTIDGLANLLLDDSQIEVRQAAARSMGGSSSPEALSYLMEALRDSFWWYERENAAVDLLNAIERIGSAAVTPLIEALQDDEGTVRRFAARLLGQLHDARAVEPLGMTLYDLHHDVGSAAAEALSHFGAAGLEVLIEALGHPEAAIREHAIHGLSAIKDDRVLPFLIQMLEDPERLIRKRSLEAVIRLHDPRAVSVLQEIAADRSDREFSTLAKQALREM